MNLRKDSKRRMDFFSLPERFEPLGNGVRLVVPMRVWQAAKIPHESNRGTGIFPMGRNWGRERSPQ